MFNTLICKDDSFLDQFSPIECFPHVQPQTFGQVWWPIAANKKNNNNKNKKKNKIKTENKKNEKKKYSEKNPSKLSWPMSAKSDT